MKKKKKKQDDDHNSNSQMKRFIQMYILNGFETDFL